MMSAEAMQATAAARTQFRRGLLASGISVDGLMPSDNPDVARRMFREATATDPGMCDAWRARILVGEDSLGVLEAAWAARDTLARELRHARVRDAEFRPRIYDGAFLNVPVMSVDSLRGAYAIALVRAGRLSRADEVLRLGSDPDDPFDVELLTYARGRLQFEAKRWPDVLACFPVDKRWHQREYASAAAAMSATALASLGVFEDAFRRADEAVKTECVPAATTVALYTQGMCLRHLGKDDDAAQLLRRVFSRDPKFAPARTALDDPNMRLVLTDPESIAARTDPWDVDSAPSRKASDAARHSAQAAALLAEGEEELSSMLGMDAVKRQITLIRSTTKVNQARVKMGLPVPVTSRHTLLVGPAGTGKTTVARALTKQFCGLGILRRPTVTEVSKRDLIGTHLGETENATRRVIESAMGGALFFDEIHNLNEESYSKGDPYGKAIIETLLPTLENDRDDLVVFGAGYPRAVDRMLNANQGLRRRFPTVIEFSSYTPDELWQLTCLMVEKNEDIIDPATREVLMPTFTKFYLEESETPDGDVVRGIDWLGNGGFVRTLVEKANDHRNHRLDDENLDALLASDDEDVSEELVRRFRLVSAEDFAAGIEPAVAQSREARASHDS